MAGWNSFEGILLILLGIYTLCNPGRHAPRNYLCVWFSCCHHRNFRYCILCKNRALYRLRTYHCSGDWNFKSPCRTNASDVPKCRRADHDPASPNLVHCSFCFQIDPHPSGPSGRKILYYFTLIVISLESSLGCLMIIWPWVALFSTGFIIGGYLILLGIDCVVMACSDMDTGGCKNRIYLSV